MTIKGYIRGAVVAAGMFAISAPAVAQEVADLHDQRRERGVICFTDHFHYGSSAGQPTKRAAQTRRGSVLGRLCRFRIWWRVDELGEIREQEHQVWARRWRLELRREREAVPSPLMPSSAS